MANYRFKTTIQAQQCNAETFEDVYAWAQLNGVASNKTDTSFVITCDDEQFTLNNIGTTWVMKFGDNKWLIASDRRFQQLFEAV
jgi:hypothetical protein